ncbi:MAG: radical SAM protein [Parachlamydiales bacterium]|nr:radical SAM protein [Parachlamydiales bacterium]
MYDEETYENEKNNTLSLSDLVKILDDFENFEKKYSAEILYFNISGGDPLLRKDIFDFLSELNRRRKKIFMFGNPNTINEKVLKKLKDSNVNHFQFSLDGLEKTHDFFRSKGSFQDTVNKIKMLHDYSISCNIMFTLFPSNANQLIPLMNYVAKNTLASSFSFDIGSSMGNAKNLADNFTPEQIYHLFNSYYEEKEKLEKEYAIIFGEKSDYHKIINFEKSLFTPYPASITPVVSGSSIGWKLPSILSDGTTLAYRRLPFQTGKMPQMSIEEIFLGNEILKKFRRREYFTGCKNCSFYSFCRGCPANTYGLTKDPFALPPICFKKLIKREEVPVKSTYKEPDLNTSFEEEWNFIKPYHIFHALDDSFFNTNKQFKLIYLDLATDTTFRMQFLKNPEEFINSKNYKLSQDEIAWLMYRFGESCRHQSYDYKTDPIANRASQDLIREMYST